MQNEPKPIVIRRDDGYAVLNTPDLDTLSPGQKVALALSVWDQARELMEANGESLEDPRTVDRMLAKALQAAKASVTLGRYAMGRKGAQHLPALAANEITLAEFQRRSGLVVKHWVPDSGAIKATAAGVMPYGKGDHFKDVTEPLSRYLKSWKKRDFEFRHLNPAESRRRLKMVNELIENLEGAKEDLERRSRVARLSMPPK